MHYLLFYDYVPEYIERRAPLRGAHVSYARDAIARGELGLGGALKPPDSGVLLFKADSPSVVERFARSDPYVTNGLVTAWKVREWSTVVGPDAQVPLPPEL